MPRDDAPVRTWIIGETVPWTAAWSAEQRFAVAPSRSFPGAVEIIQIEAPGQGEPIFSGMHVMRQRRGLMGHLCQVCGRPAPVGDRKLFPMTTGIFVGEGAARLYASHMPVVHAACAEKAAKACPHLRALSAKPVDYPEDEPGEIKREMNAPPAMAPLAQKLPPGVRAIWSYYRVFGPRFTALVETLRRT